MADFSNIIQEINTNIADNNTQAITAEKLRTTLIDLTDTISTEQNTYEQETDQTIQDAISQFQPTVVVDNLNSTSSDEALSANQGRLINNTLEPLSNEFEKQKNIYYSTSGGEVLIGFEIKAEGVISAQNYCRVAVIIIDEEMRNTRNIAITGYKRNANASGYLYILTDANDNFLTGFQGGTGELTAVLDGNSIPQNAAKLKINYYYQTSSNSHPYAVLLKYYNIYPLTKIVPELERGRLSPTGQLTEGSTAAGGQNNTFYSNNKRTINYIQIPNGKIYLTSSIGCWVRIVEYDASFNFVKYTDVEITADTPYEINSNNSYLKFHFSMTAYNDTTNIVPDFDWYLEGNFSYSWNVKNVYPLDNGYQHFCTSVYTIDPNSTNAETNNVQDNPVYSYDDGLIALPKSYSNTGKPTRLIIYCHGAGVNYSGSTSRFPSTDLCPEYWLAEGYAVMDVDGECSSTTSTQHNLAPQSLQCYINAYQQVMKKYNLCDDGVFLGGRSMGGGMSMYILQDNTIPVIANCPVVPVMNTLWWWAYMTKARKQFLADQIGLVGTQPSWTNSTTLTTNEWNFLKNNFDVLRRWSPLWNCITDLPTNPDILFDENLRVSPSNTDVPAEVELFSSLHAKVKAPVKFFDNYADSTVPYERNAMLMYKMLLNSGCITELRMFNTSGDSDTSISTHHFELRTDRLTTITTTSGVVMENVPVVYIEMLRFWQRYEFNNKK